MTLYYRVFERLLFFADAGNVHWRAPKSYIERIHGLKATEYDNK